VIDCVLTLGRKQGRRRGVYIVGVRGERDRNRDRDHKSVVIKKHRDDGDRTAALTIATVDPPIADVRFSSNPAEVGLLLLG
jgi:hypothetical protein